MYPLPTLEPTAFVFTDCGVYKSDIFRLLSAVNGFQVLLQVMEQEGAATASGQMKKPEAPESSAR